jgi:hypothetical protein
VRCFIEVFAVGADREGAVAALEDILAKIARCPPAQIAVTPDDRILAEMTRCIFRAGLSSTLCARRDRSSARL